MKPIRNRATVIPMQAPLLSTRGATPSFVAPVPCAGALRPGGVSTCFLTARRPSRRRGRCPDATRVWRACTNGPVPEEDKPEGGSREDGQKSSAVKEKDANLARIEEMTGTTLAEIDTLAEEWIGANLSRWEWYERVKAKRERMLKAGRENEEKFDNELQELKRTFMEIDALLGTGMLDERSEISPAGWSTVVIITLLYVSVGFWAFELVVRFITGLSPSFP